MLSGLALSTTLLNCDSERWTGSILSVFNENQIAWLASITKWWCTNLHESQWGEEKYLKWNFVAVARQDSLEMKKDGKKWEKRFSRNAMLLPCRHILLALPFSVVCLFSLLLSSLFLHIEHWPYALLGLLILANLSRSISAGNNGRTEPNRQQQRRLF